METCERCKYWDLFRKENEGGEANGVCTRYPPVLDLSYRGETTDDDNCWAQPVTVSSQSCGEFKQKPRT